MRSQLNRYATLALGAVMALASLPALAQPAPSPPASGAAPAPAAPATPTPPEDAKTEEARTRYERGVQLYLEGQYDLALIEFKRAYELAPSYRILYNIGQVQAQQGNAAAAMRTFEQYLADGGNVIPDQRREEVQKEISNMRQRTATMKITTVDGAEVLIDDVPVGTAPLPASVLVNAGRRTVSARKEGHVAASKVLLLAGLDDVAVVLDLPLVPRATETIREKTTVVVADTDYTWVGWVTTGVFSAGALVTGLLTLDASSDLATERDTVDLERPAEERREAIDDAQSKARALAITTDVLIGAAVVAGALTVYFTISGDDEDDKAKPATAVAPRKPTVGVGVGPAAINLSGRF